MITKNTIAQEYEAKLASNEAKPVKVKKRASLGILDIFGKKNIVDETKSYVDNKGESKLNDEDQISHLLSSNHNDFNQKFEISDNKEITNVISKEFDKKPTKIKLRASVDFDKNGDDMNILKKRRGSVDLSD